MEKEKFHIDFIGIGSAKCGTTTVSRWLMEHPEISCYSKKELNFFSERTRIHMPMYDKYKLFGIKQYQDIISKDVDFDKVVGEFSVYYLYSVLAVKRIQQHFPNVKIIITLRNPVDRAFSMYKMDRYLYGDICMEFEEALQKHPEYIEYSKYSKYLKYYFDAFPNHNIMVILLEDIKNSPKQVIQELYSFLGVNPNFVPPSFGKVINPNQKAKYPRLKKFIVKFTKYNRKLSITRFGFVSKHISNSKISKLLTDIDRRNTCDAKVNSMEPNTRKFLLEKFANDIHECEIILNRNLSMWKR